ncbi:DctP family TRAP transporter solute-binding subunit [Paracoccus spongiarum]|uniref:DctP family TRAP transporter solute-binding subunit n=1 Tax=Paracoccus spongiarum TaxID=3064387 RepID=A0ABT9JFV6_9RHOB|nr:DctP family TRAP transporter solute-binding subunit [Paracoccus sp. 2205BS29-5]MDP5308721.1 DctP family TRAP transporter solute-binding subunit [Paracoccus sp. 2205BS29-5]
MTTFFRTTCLAAILSVTALSAQAQTALRLAHAAPDTDLQQTLATFFKEQLEERSGGEITVTIFPQGQLGNDAAMVDGTRSGIIDVVMTGLNNLTGLVPDAGAFELPFIFPTRADAYAALDGEVGQQIATQFEAHGLKMLGYPENGYRNMTNNRGPIVEPADVAGLQMRVNNSKALGDMFQLLGATPQQIPVAELYTALETGVVDAQDHPIGIVQSFKFDEVQEYLSLTQHAYSALALGMNLNKFNGLTEYQQKMITEVAAEAVAMQRDLSQEREEEMLTDLEGKGMKINRDVNAKAFQEAVRPVWDSFVQENGDAVVKAITGE